MSLLIKALEKADSGKGDEDRQALSLEPLDKAGDEVRRPTSQQAAAAVFNAKQARQGNRPGAIIWIAIAGLLLLAALGWYFYSTLQSLNPQAPGVNSSPLVQTPAAQVPFTPDTSVSEQSAADPAAQATSPIAGAANVSEPQLAANTAPPKDSVTTATPDSASISPAPARSPATSVVRPSARTHRSTQLSFGEEVGMSNDGAVKVTRNSAATGVNPVLWAGYQAYNNGDDVGAQRQYRQVLQGDVRNVDALLGMAAVAARQGRNSDAAGWYGKVLEIEPRNGVAQAAMMNLQGQGDPVSQESRVKTLLAQQPEAAYLHAALGDIYVQQSQWPAAQQAYFQAYHFAPDNAGYAYNLAVSLDQLGKPKLALPYYQRALELINRAGGNGGGIDRGQLETRISQLL